MGPAVAQPEDGEGMGEHLAAGVEVPVGVVGERGVEEIAAVVLGQQVEQQRGRVDAPRRGQPQHARLRRGLVVGHVAERVQAAVVDGRGRLRRRPPSPRRPSAAMSASSRARHAGSCRARACSATGRAAMSRRRGAREGWYEDCSPTRSPTGRGATWARIGSPSATAASIRPSRSRQASGRRWLWASESDSGHARARHHGPDQLELAVGVGPEVGDQLHDAVPGVGHAERDRLELVGAGAQRRRRVAAWPCGGSASATSRTRWPRPAGPRSPARAWPPRPPGSPPPGGRPARP